MPQLYIIAGCNGAGKTTASYTILPEILNCKEFVNADNIALGISPFNPESVAFEAGRIMLQRINDLLEDGVDFAFETTLATRSYVSFVKKAQQKGYTVHNIPPDVIRQRYYRAIKNPLRLYTPICDKWVLIDNMKVPSKAMITKDYPTSFNDLATRILDGVNKALRKLAENAAANNESLIIGDEHGNVKSVPAKELLRELDATHSEDTNK